MKVTTKNNSVYKSTNIVKILKYSLSLQSRHIEEYGTDDGYLVLFISILKVLDANKLPPNRAKLLCFGAKRFIQMQLNTEKKDNLEMSLELGHSQ